VFLPEHHGSALVFSGVPGVPGAVCVVKLGKREIDALACPPDRRDMIVFDDELTGFAVRVTCHGAKVFIFQYWQGGKVHRLRLGAYGDLTPAQARKLAEAARGKVAGGGSPTAERRARIAAEAGTMAARKQRAEADALTFAVLLEQWQALGLKDRRERYRAEAVRALRVNFDRLAGLPAHQVDAAAARRTLDSIAKDRGSMMARRSHAYARAMYGWAMRRDLLSANPFAGLTMEGREVSRDRVLSDVEIGEVWRAAGTLGWPYGPYLRFLMLTLQREAETAGLRRPELAPDMSTWELPGERTKNGKPHLVHLDEPARAILRDAPKLPVDRTKSGKPRPTASPLVFTTTGTAPIASFFKPKQRLDAAIVAERAELAAESGTEPAPLVPWRLHDLRRTGVTVLARLGVRWEVADKLLNHAHGAISGVAAVYQRHDFMTEREAALVAWAAHVLAMAKGRPAAGNVVDFRRA
jgi:hypothetical protein